MPKRQSIHIPSVRLRILLLKTLPGAENKLRDSLRKLNTNTTAPDRLKRSCELSR